MRRLDLRLYGRMRHMYDFRGFGMSIRVDVVPDGVAARAYLLHLVGCTLFSNKSATHVHVVHLEAFQELGQSGGYAWGAAALVHMYDQLNEACQTLT